MKYWLFCLLFAQVAVLASQPAGASNMSDSLGHARSETDAFCIGSVIADLGTGATVEWGNQFSGAIDGRLATDVGVGEREFAEQMEREKSEAESLPHFTLKTRLYRVLAPDQHVRAFLVRASAVSSDRLDVRAYRWVDGYVFKAHAPAMIGNETVVAERLIAGLRRLVPRSDKAVVSPGHWCFAGASIEAEGRRNSASATVSWKDLPGFRMTIATDLSDAPVSPEGQVAARIARVDQVDGAGSAAMIRPIRARRIGGREGVEAVRRAKLDDGGELVMGFAQVDRVPGDPANPGITLSFDLDPVDPVTLDPLTVVASVSDVLARWDRIIQSIKVRSQ